MDRYTTRLNGSCVECLCVLSVFVSSLTQAYRPSMDRYKTRLNGSCVECVLQLWIPRMQKLRSASAATPDQASVLHWKPGFVCFACCQGYLSLNFAFPFYLPALFPILFMHTMTCVVAVNQTVVCDTMTSVSPWDDLRGCWQFVKYQVTNWSACTHLTMERIICTISFLVSCHMVAHTYTRGVRSVRIADVSCRSKVVASSFMCSTLAQGANSGCVEMVFCC